MVMTCPPTYHPGNFLMKTMNPINSGHIYSYARSCTYLRIAIWDTHTRITIGHTIGYGIFHMHMEHPICG